MFLHVRHGKKSYTAKCTAVLAV